jgi:hypothetical protein
MGRRARHQRPGARQGADVAEAEGEKQGMITQGWPIARNI